MPNTKQEIINLLKSQKGNELYYAIGKGSQGVFVLVVRRDSIEKSKQEIKEVDNNIKKPYVGIVVYDEKILSITSNKFKESKVGLQKWTKANGFTVKVEESEGQAMDEEAETSESNEKKEKITKSRDDVDEESSESESPKKMFLRIKGMIDNWITLNAEIYGEDIGREFDSKMDNSSTGSNDRHMSLAQAKMAAMKMQAIKKLPKGKWVKLIGMDDEQIPQKVGSEVEKWLKSQYKHLHKKATEVGEVHHLN